MSSQPVGSSTEGEAGVPLGDGELAPAGGVDRRCHGFAAIAGGDLSIDIQVWWMTDATRDHLATRLLDVLEGAGIDGDYVLRWS